MRRLVVPGAFAVVAALLASGLIAGSQDGGGPVMCGDQACPSQLPPPTEGTPGPQGFPISIDANAGGNGYIPLGTGRTQASGNYRVARGRHEVVITLVGNNHHNAQTLYIPLRGNTVLLGSCTGDFTNPKTATPCPRPKGRTSR